MRLPYSGPIFYISASRSLPFLLHLLFLSLSSPSLLLHSSHPSFLSSLDQYLETTLETSCTSGTLALEILPRHFFLSLLPSRQDQAFASSPPPLTPSTRSTDSLSSPSSAEKPRSTNAPVHPREMRNPRERNESLTNVARMLRHVFCFNSLDAQMQTTGLGVGHASPFKVNRKTRFLAPPRGFLTTAIVFLITRTTEVTQREGGVSQRVKRGTKNIAFE